MVVKTIDIEGVQRPLMFGMHLTEIVQVQAAKGNFTGTKMQAILIYGGHDNYCQCEGIENTLKFSECFRHVEKVRIDGTAEQQQQLSDIVDTYMSSKPVVEMMEAVARLSDTKKKEAGKKLENSPLVS